MGNGNAYLSIQSLTKRYRDVVALDDVSLDIEEGECVTLLGPSGSGKSTLLKTLAGFEAVTSGRVYFQSEDITDLSPSQRNSGMVFQNYALFPHLTVAQNIEYGLKIRKWDSKRRKARIAEMLELVGLTGYESRMPSELSGGQQQRIAIARALAYSPPVLFMDEPLGALDRSLRVEMVTQIRQIHRDTGTTLIYVTHDQQEALALSDRVAIMKLGQIIECDRPEQLYRHPQTSFVATFFGDSNLLTASATRAGGVVTASVGESEVDVLGWERDQLPAHLAIRPRGFRILDAAAAGSTDRTMLRLRGAVIEKLFLGDEYEFLVRLADGSVLKVLKAVADSAGTNLGDTITLGVSQSDLIPIE